MRIQTDISASNCRKPYRTNKNMAIPIVWSLPGSKQRYTYFVPTLLPWDATTNQCLLFGEFKS